MLDKIKAWLASPSAQVIAKAFLRGFGITALVLVAPEIAEGQLDAGALIKSLCDATFQYVFWNTCFSAAIASAWAEMRRGAFDSTGSVAPVTFKSIPQPPAPQIQSPPK